MSPPLIEPIPLDGIASMVAACSLIVPVPSVPGTAAWRPVPSYSPRGVKAAASTGPVGPALAVWMAREGSGALTERRGARALGPEGPMACGAQRQRKQAAREGFSTTDRASAITV